MATLPSADQITALSALVAAVGTVVTSVLAYLSQRRAGKVHEVVSDVRASLATGNGHTVGENSTEIARQVLPGRAAEDAAHEAASGTDTHAA